MGVLTWLVFTWIGVRYAGLWGVAAGVLNCVPYAGPTFIMAASALAALIQFKSPGMVALVAGASVGITALEGFLLAPPILGQAGTGELGGRVRRDHVLGMVMGRPRTDRGGAGVDDHQDHRRSRGVVVVTQ